MKKIVWDEMYSVGVAELDNHHRRLAELINSLIDHAQAASDRQLVEKAMSALRAYAFYHFGREELLMAQSGFPSLGPHLTEHEMFCETLKQIGNNAAMGLVDLKRLSDFLVDWWSHHILEVDMQYKPFMAAADGEAGTPAPSHI